jgi:hypothetical protein
MVISTIAWVPPAFADDAAEGIITESIIIEETEPAEAAAPFAISPLNTYNDAIWNGTVDVTWYSAEATSFHIQTPAQLAGVAAIVNGIYNEGAPLLGNPDYVTGTFVGGASDGYWYGIDDFNGKTIYIDADLDMGGYETGGVWAGPNYMPIGGQYSMQLNDSSTLLSSSFCGNLDGQGHKIYNIYCERASMNPSGSNPEPYKESQSVGLIGRLGVHDSDPVEMRPVNPSVRNLSVDGYISARRSVGGIVGKIGKTSYNNGDGSVGGIIENCANFAEIHGTDAKGTGGIAGAAWNGGRINNCYNAGSVANSGAFITGGIAAGNEISVTNCYNVGTVSAGRDTFAVALGTNAGGSFVNCYWLEGSAPYGIWSASSRDVIYEKTASEMKADAFITELSGTGSGFVKDENGVNNGYPILAWQAGITDPEEPGTPGAPGSGDLLGTGHATVADALFAAQSILAGGTLTEAQKAAADMDDDGVITMKDIILIARAAAL